MPNMIVKLRRSRSISRSSLRKTILMIESLIYKRNHRWTRMNTDKGNSSVCICVHLWFHSILYQGEERLSQVFCFRLRAQISNRSFRQHATMTDHADAMADVFRLGEHVRG